MANVEDEPKVERKNKNADQHCVTPHLSLVSFSVWSDEKWDEQRKLKRFKKLVRKCMKLNLVSTVLMHRRSGDQTSRSAREGWEIDATSELKTVEIIPSQQSQQLILSHYKNTPANSNFL